MLVCRTAAHRSSRARSDRHIGSQRNGIGVSFSPFVSPRENGRDASEGARGGREARVWCLGPAVPCSACELQPYLPKTWFTLTRGRGARMYMHNSVYDSLTHTTHDTRRMTHLQHNVFAYCYLPMAVLGMACCRAA